MNIFGKNVKIPDSLARYFALKRSFRELADLTYESAVKRFSDDDMTTAYGMTDDGSISDGFTNWGRRFARHSLQNIVDLGVGSLTEEDCFTVDAAAYESDYLDTSAIDAFLESGTTRVYDKKVTWAGEVAHAAVRAAALSVERSRQ